MARDFLTDDQVEEEIERLRSSDLVKLARKEARVRYQRRQVLYNLRVLEKKGKELAAAGITIDILQEMGEDALSYLQDDGI